MDAPAVRPMTTTVEEEMVSLASSATSGAKSFVVTFLPGAAQGVTTVILGHPLDTAKTRMQACGPQAQRSAMVTIWRMARHEGLRSLFRGCTPPLLMEGMKRSLQFALWDVFRASQKSEPDAELSWMSAAGQRVLSVIGSNSFLSGAVAGGIGTLIGCPMHVIKIQTQYQTREATRNAWTCTLAILERDGLLGLYRGFKYNLLKDVCFAGAYLGMYGWLRDWSRGQDEKAPGSTARAFAAGATASVVTWTLLYPLDTMKTLVQAGQQQRLAAELRQHPGRLYRGLAASLLKAGPVSGVSMCVYELTKRKMDEWDHQAIRATRCDSRDQ